MNSKNKITIGAIVALLTLIATGIGIVRTQTVKIDENQLDRLVNSYGKTVHQIESQPTTNIAIIEPSKLQKRSITLNNLESQAIDSANANISVAFNNVMGKNFAKLTITPSGKKPVFLPVYNSGQYLEFNSSTGAHIASVLSVNFLDRNIVIDISKTN